MMNKVECFKIQLLKSQDNIFDLTSSTPILRKSFSHSLFCLNPTIIEADPFLFVKDDTLFLFYESKKLFSPGVIKMTCTKDLCNWSKPKIVLREPFHLSYPFVFEDNGKIFMIPETGTDNSIRLYIADTSDLTTFSFVKKLLEQPLSDDITINYADSSILKLEGKYYLFTTIQYNGINHLELYVSDSLCGNYNKHPLSPICCGNLYGRNAGSIFQINDLFYRVSQDCIHRYGDNVSVHHITKLTTEDYKEEVVYEKIFSPEVLDGFYNEGGHQFNVVSFRGNMIIATDAKEYICFLLQRIIKKIIRLILND